jgi:N-acetyl sugar amidotransferase
MGNIEQIICKKCVMDRSAKEIVFDDKGVCNFCHIAQKELELSREMKPQLGEMIKKMRRGRKYDCLIGLSGGMDSSMALHHAVKMGLFPLCFSVDNFWNSKESDENIMCMVETLKVPFFRYTIDKKKFFKLQGSFLKAGLINAEIPTDHILMATTYEVAAKNDIKYVISGGNVATESIMPPSWSYTARDLVHIKDVYFKTTGEKLTGLPLLGLWKFNYYRWIKGIRIVYLLDYLDYNRNKDIAILEKEYGYKPYGAKHEESLFTKWYQNYYLFKKFGIDKRKAHYSSMINSGQMTRQEAMEELQREPEYIPLNVESRVSKYAKREHSEFKSDVDSWNKISKVIKTLRRYGLVKT